MLVTLALSVSRVSDAAALFLVDRFRRRVEQNLPPSRPRLCADLSELMRGEEFGWVVGTLCPSRSVGYLALTMMARDQVLGAIVGAAVLEAGLWWLFPIGIDFLMLDLVLTFAVTAMWPSNLGQAFRRAALGCPLCVGFIPYIGCIGWFCCLAVAGDLPLFYELLEWLELVLEPQETAVALRLPDERIWDSCRRPEAPNLPAYIPPSYGPWTFVGLVMASIQVMALTMWRWAFYLRTRGQAAIGME